MQGGGKGALGSVMEAAANVAASAKSGLDKTKAVVQEKVERMSSRDEVEKDMATLRKEEKLDLAELRKSKAYSQNASAATAPSGAVTPNFTDGGGFYTVGSHNNKLTGIISGNTDYGSPVLAAATNQVESETINSSGNLSGTSMVDSNVNPNPARIHADYNPNLTEIPDVVSNPNHPVMPAQGFQPIPEVDSNTEMPVQMVQPVGQGLVSENNPRSGTHMLPN